MNDSEQETIKSADGKGPELTRKEEDQIEERSAPRAAVVYETVREEGEFELSRNVSALAWSGLAAGLSMGFSLVAEGLIRSHLEESSWRPLFAKLGYSAGFLIVILGRQQLFTENTLTVVLPFLQQKDAKTLYKMLRLWGVVLAANLIGAFLFSWVIHSSNIYQPEVKQVFHEIGKEAFEGAWFTIFVQAIFAGWLIALMVWLLPAAETARVWIIIIMTYLVALGGYSHIVVGTVEVSYYVMSGGTTWANYLFDWMIPTLIGNTLGGVSLVAVLAHAQVVNEKKGPANTKNISIDRSDRSDSADHTA